MPELPDLVYIEKRLKAALPGKKIAQIKVTEPIVLRILIDALFDAALRDKRFKKSIGMVPFWDLNLMRTLN
jgi:formamidopyrimidine-DNA glycosylase